MSNYGETECNRHLGEEKGLSGMGLCGKVSGRREMLSCAPKGEQQLDDQKLVKGNPRFGEKSTRQGRSECGSQPDWRGWGYGG